MSNVKSVCLDWCRLANKKNMLKIALGIPETYRFEPGPEALELDSQVFSNVSIEVRTAPTGHYTQVDVQAHATVSLICDRTLKEFLYPLVGRCTVLYVADSAGVATGPVGEYDELCYFTNLDRYVDLRPIVRDTVMLAVPARAVAPTAESVDIQSVFGGPDQAVDERWVALRTISEDSP